MEVLKVMTENALLFCGVAIAIALVLVYLVLQCGVEVTFQNAMGVVIFVLLTGFTLGLRVMGGE